MGAPRDIPTYRLIGPPNQNMDGINGRTAGWIIGTGTYRTRTNNNGAGATTGSYFNDGETWYGIIPTRVSSAGHQPGRIHNWHDEPVSGFTWGSVSPVAVDSYPPGSFVDPESGFTTEITMEYTSSTPNPTKHYNIHPWALDHFIFIFIKIKFKADATGTLDVWVQNYDSPSLSDGPIISVTQKRTLNNSAGFFPGCQFWQGMYDSSGFTSGPNIQVDHMLSMWGLSMQQAWDDSPSFVQFQENTTNGINATCTSLGVINTSTFPIPNDWAAQLSDPPGGGGGGGGGSFPTTGVLTSFTGADESPL